MRVHQRDKQASIKSMIAVHSINLDTGEDQIWNVEYANAFNSVSDCAFYGETLYVLDKSGVINSLSGGNFEQLYSTTFAAEPRSKSIPRPKARKIYSRRQI